MKKAYLVVLVIATVASIIFGSLYHIGGYFRGFGSGRDKVSVEEILPEAGGWDGEAIRNVTVNADFADIEVRGGDEFQVSYQGRERYRFEVEQRGDTLYLEQPNRGPEVSVGLGNFANEKSELVITLPKGQELTLLSAETSMGEVKLRDAKLARCELHTAMGGVIAENSEIGQADLSTEMGDVEAEGLTFTNLTADTNMGSVTIRTAQDLSDYEISLTTDLGSVEVYGDDIGTSFSQKGSAGRITADTDMGDVTLGQM